MKRFALRASKCDNKCAAAITRSLRITEFAPEPNYVSVHIRLGGAFPVLEVAHSASSVAAAAGIAPET